MDINRLAGDVKDRKPHWGEQGQRQVEQRFAEYVKIFASVKFFDSVVLAGIKQKGKRIRGEEVRP